MKKAFAMKWADALESGEYKQTKEKLFDGKGYCCLGVACVLAKKKFEKDTWMNDGTWKIDGEDDTLLPDDVMEKIGMAGNDGILRSGEMIKFGKKEFESLADANDEGVKFKAIAKFVRDNYKQL